MPPPPPSPARPVPPNRRRQVIRAIGVLEGIALVGNPEFAIIDEAFPYVAKRL